MGGSEEWRAREHTSHLKGAAAAQSLLRGTVSPGRPDLVFQDKPEIIFPSVINCHLIQKFKAQHGVKTTRLLTDSGCRPPVGAFGSRKMLFRIGHLQGQSAKPGQSQSLLLENRIDSPRGLHRTRTKQVPRGVTSHS